MPKKEVKKRKAAASTKAVAKNAASARVRNLTKKQSRQKAKKEVKNQASLPGSFKLTASSFMFIKKFWRPLLGIVLVYTILNLIFASSVLGNINSGVHDIKNSVDKHSSKLANALGGFSTLAISGSGAQSSTLQSFLLIIESLVIIWALRHLFSGEQIGVKQAYYHSTTPLIPFLLVLFVIVLQLLPVAIGSALLVLILSTVGSGAAAVVFSLLFMLLCAWSIYMISSSIFALYIVTLPDMQPRKALRSAKNLVRFRRWQLVRKILFLPLAVFVILGLITVPLILLASFLVPPVYFVLGMLTVLYAHTYLYSLYKGLLA